MPQLDKVTFLSQYFWLCVFFFGFYIFQLKFFLPEMSRILKFRKKRLSESSAVLLQQENNTVRNSAETVLENLFLNSKNVFKDSFSKTDSWFLKQTDFFGGKFKKGNQNYLQSIAKKNLSNSFAIRAVGLNLASSSAQITKQGSFNNSNLSNKTFWGRLTQHISQKGSFIKRSYTATSPSLLGNSASGVSSLSKTKNPQSVNSKKDKLGSGTSGKASTQLNKEDMLVKARKNQGGKDLSSKINDEKKQKKTKKNK